MLVGLARGGDLYLLARPEKMLDSGLIDFKMFHLVCRIMVNPHSNSMVQIYLDIDMMANVRCKRGI